MEGLKKINVYAKLGKTLSDLASVLAIIGAVFCTIAAVQVGTVGDAQLGTIGGTVIKGIIADYEGSSKSLLLAVLLFYVAFCFVETIVALLFKSYFKKELKAETPFTMQGAARANKIGIITFIVFAVLIAVECVLILSFNAEQEFATVNTACIVSMIVGIGFFTLSPFLEYGAKILEEKK